MDMINLTVAQALIKFLNAQYLCVDAQEYKLVAGLFGQFAAGNVAGLGEALASPPAGFKVIQGHSPQGMVYAATAFAKQNQRRQLFACTAPMGPAAINMVSGAALATQNRLPLLLLPADPPLASGLVPGTGSLTESFKPVSRYWQRIERPGQLMAALTEAVRILVSPTDTGAVTLVLPQDIQCELRAFPTSFFDKQVHKIDRLPPSEAALSQAVQQFLGAKRPLIIAGGGVNYSQAVEALQKISAQFAIPVAETPAGKGSLSHKHPSNVGIVGLNGSRAANLLIKEADCILAVGTQLTEFRSLAHHGLKRPGLTLIQLNLDSGDGQALQAHALQADARLGLQLLHCALLERAYVVDSGYQEVVAKYRLGWLRDVERFYKAEREQALTQTQVLGVLQDCLDEQAVVVAATGGIAADVQRLWQVDNASQCHTGIGDTCLGFEVAGSLGVALAMPDRPVVALVGDGSFIAGNAELLTALQEQLNVTVVVFDNHGYQSTQNLQRLYGCQGQLAEFRFRDEQGKLGGDYIPIDITAYGRGLGVNSYAVESYQQLREVFTETAAYTGPTLISVKVAPETMSGGLGLWDRQETLLAEKLQEYNKE